MQINLKAVDKQTRTSDVIVVAASVRDDMGGYVEVRALQESIQMVFPGQHQGTGVLYVFILPSQPCYPSQKDGSRCH